MRPLPFLMLITLLVIQLAMLLVSLVGFGLNQSGHSSFDPLSVTAAFAPIAVVALVFLILKPYSRAAFRFKLAILILSASGVAFGFFVRSMGIMLSDAEWIAAGQPARNLNSTMWLICYGGVTFTLMALALKLPLPGRRRLATTKVVSASARAPQRPRAFVD